MEEALADQIVEKMKEAEGLHHRLVLVVASAGGGKSAVLKEVQRRTGAALIDLSNALSHEMVDLDSAQRAQELPRLLAEVVNGAAGDAVILDSPELIFHPSIKEDPLKMLRTLSHSRTLVVAWSGAIEGDELTHTRWDQTDHRYPLRDLLVASVE